MSMIFFKFLSKLIQQIVMWFRKSSKIFSIH